MSVASFALSDRVVTIQMHDPARRNALGAAMLAELDDAFSRVDEGVRAVVLRAGLGNAVWCAGFDIGALAPGMDPLAANGALQGLFHRIRECPAPVIGMLHGSAWGGGTDLALRCDLLVADETASLAFTPARLGLPYDAAGLLNALWRAGPAMAFEMFATAEPVGSARALSAGLVSRVVAAEALEAETYALARRIAENAPLTVRSARRHLQAWAEAMTLPPEIAAALEAERLAALHSEDFSEGLAAFRGKRAPRFAGR